jgi:hypothetical protein
VLQRHKAPNKIRGKWVERRGAGGDHNSTEGMFVPIFPYDRLSGRCGDGAYSAAGNCGVALDFGDFTIQSHEEASHGC